MLISIGTAVQLGTARRSFSTSKRERERERETGSSKMTIELFDTLCSNREVWSGELMVFIISSPFPFHFLYKLAQVTRCVPKRAPRRRPAEPHLLILPRLLPSLSLSRSLFLSMAFTFYSQFLPPFLLFGCSCHKPLRKCSFIRTSAKLLPSSPHKRRPVK